jgi:hypothetical protein
MVYAAHIVGASISIGASKAIVQKIKLVATTSRIATMIPMKWVAQTTEVFMERLC